MQLLLGLNLEVNRDRPHFLLTVFPWSLVVSRCHSLPSLPEEVSLEPSAAPSAGYPPGPGTASAPGLPPSSPRPGILHLASAAGGRACLFSCIIPAGWEGQGRARSLPGSAFCAAWGHRGFGFCLCGLCAPRAPQGRPLWPCCMALCSVASSSGSLIPFPGWPLSPRLLSLGCGGTVGPGFRTCSSFLLLPQWHPPRHPSTLPLSSAPPRLPCPLSAPWCSLGADGGLLGVGAVPPGSEDGGEGPGDLDSLSERPCSEITGIALPDPKLFSASRQPHGLGCLTARASVSSSAL